RHPWWLLHFLPRRHETTKKTLRYTSCVLRDFVVAFGGCRWRARENDVPGPNRIRDRLARLCAGRHRLGRRGIRRSRRGGGSSRGARDPRPWPRRAAGHGAGGVGPASAGPGILGRYGVACRSDDLETAKHLKAAIGARCWATDATTGWALRGRVLGASRQGAVHFGRVLGALLQRHFPAR